MFQSTFSQYIVDELYGTGKSISPQIGITYAFDQSDNRISLPQQQNQTIDPIPQQGQEKMKHETIANVLDPENSQVLCSSQSKANLNDSPLRHQSAITTEQENCNDKNLSVQSLLLAIQRLQASNAQKDNQVSRLQQLLDKKEATQKTAKQQNTINEPTLQMKVSQATPEMLKLSRKLKQYRKKNMDLEQANKKLLEKLHNMEAQFEELFSSQIKYLKSQLQYQKEKNQTQKIQLQDKLKEKNTQIKISTKSKSPYGHKCDLCRQYELLNSLSKLKGQIQGMMIREQELKDNLRIITNEYNRLKDILNRQAPTTKNSQTDS